MIALKVFLIVFACLFILSKLKVGGMAEYSADGFLVKVRVGAVWVRLYPKTKKEKKKKQKKEKKQSKSEKPIDVSKAQQELETTEVQQAEQPPTTEPSKSNIEKEGEPKKGGKIAKVKRYLPLIGEAAGELRQKIVIERMDVRLTAAAQDAMGAAMAFGYSNMALGMLLPILEQNFTVKKKSVCTDVDFNAQEPVIYLCAAVSLQLGQLVSFALRYFIRFLRIYRKTNGVK